MLLQRARVILFWEKVLGLCPESWVQGVRLRGPLAESDAFNAMLQRIKRQHNIRHERLNIHVVLLNWPTSDLGFKGTHVIMVLSRSCA